MRKKGLDKNAVLDVLRDAREKDLKYADGRILSSMCTSPHPLSKKVYCAFIETNLGDAGLFKGTRALEEKVISSLGRLLGDKNACGFVVSGGTEANITAMWAARNKAKKPTPEVVLPASAHFSFDKAGDMLGLKLRKAKLNADFSVDVGDVKRKINKSTVALVGMAGSTERGVVDDVEALAELAVKHRLHMHVDAAFGGFVIPFLRELGYGVRNFDFSIDGVDSITVDPHKMGLAPVPGGCILFRQGAVLKHIETHSPYLTERSQFTISGTRSGASVASIYAVTELLGMEGYRKNVKRCMEITLGLYSAVKKLGFDVIKPTMNVLVFGSKRQDEIARELAKRGWMVSRTREGEIRLVIMPHVSKKSAANFIADLEAVKNV